MRTRAPTDPASQPSPAGGPTSRPSPAIIRRLLGLMVTGFTSAGASAVSRVLR